MLDFTSILAIIQQFRNPLLADHLPRIQGVVPSSDRVSYYGSKWGFSFFSWKGRFLGLPDQRAIDGLKGCRDLAGPERLWKELAGL